MQIGDLVTRDTAERVYVYILFESDTRETRYVGKSGDPVMRYRMHAGLRSGTRARSISAWFEHVRARGADIHMQIVAVCATDREACKLELKLILQHRKHLLNAYHHMQYGARGKRHGVRRLPNCSDYEAEQAAKDTPLGKHLRESIEKHITGG